MDIIHDKSLASSYSVYLAKEYSEIMKKIKEINDAIKELKDTPQPIGKFIWENWVMPALYALTSLIVIITFIIQTLLQ